MAGKVLDVSQQHDAMIQKLPTQSYIMLDYNTEHNLSGIIIPLCLVLVNGITKTRTKKTEKRNKVSLES